MTKNKIPKFESYAQEACFWDSRDIVDHFSPKRVVVLDFSETKNKMVSLINAQEN